MKAVQMSSLTYCTAFSFAKYTYVEIIIVISSTPFIVNHTPASHRGRMNAILPLIMGLGNILGPGIMGFILKSSSTSSGWRIIGIVMIIFTTFMFILEKYDKKIYLLTYESIKFYIKFKLI